MIDSAEKEPNACRQTYDLVCQYFYRFSEKQKKQQEKVILKSQKKKTNIDQLEIYF